MSSKPSPDGQKSVSEMSAAEIEALTRNLVRQAAQQRVTARNELDTEKALAKYQINPK